MHNNFCLSETISMDKQYLINLIRPHFSFVRGGTPIEDCSFNQLYAIHLDLPKRKMKSIATQALKTENKPQQLSMFDYLKEN
jgi:hypothetical protein